MSSGQKVSALKYRAFNSSTPYCFLAQIYLQVFTHELGTTTFINTWHVSMDCVSKSKPI